jgi:hypothetical protein
MIASQSTWLSSTTNLAAPRVGFALQSGFMDKSTSGQADRSKNPGEKVCAYHADANALCDCSVIHINGFGIYPACEWNLIQQGLYLELNAYKYHVFP